MGLGFFRNSTRKITHTYFQVYKTFMDILHTLQKSQKSSVSDVRPPPTNDQPVTDPNLPQVLSKVQVLFKDQPDLLKDFTQFLPEYQSVSAHLDLQDVKNFALSNGPEGRSLDSRFSLPSRR